MKFTLAGLLALALTASAAPAMENSEPEPSAPAPSACGTQIFACCSDIHIENGSGGLADVVGELVTPLEDIADFITGLLPRDNDESQKKCYRNTGTICKGIAACCPAGGQCNAITGGGPPHH